MCIGSQREMTAVAPAVRVADRVAAWDGYLLEGDWVGREGGWMPCVQQAKSTPAFDLRLRC